MSSPQGTQVKRMELINSTAFITADVIWIEDFERNFGGGETSKKKIKWFGLVYNLSSWCISGIFLIYDKFPHIIGPNSLFVSFLGMNILDSPKQPQ